MSYFPYNKQIGTCSSKSNEKDTEFQYNFIIICRYLNLLKNQDNSTSLNNSLFL
jgi:hypothetical protein